MSQAKHKRKETKSQAQRRDWRTERRHRAWALHQQTWSNAAIARVLGVTQAAVSQWFSAVKQHGRAALNGRARPGRPPKLSPTQRQQLIGYLEQGPRAYGFRGEVWTCARIARLIRRQFQIDYSPSQVSRILKRIHWTPQKPIRRQRTRDEDAIAHWRRYTWPALKKSRKTRLFHHLCRCVRIRLMAQSGANLRAVWLHADHGGRQSTRSCVRHRWTDPQRRILPARLRSGVEWSRSR